MAIALQSASGEGAFWLIFPQAHMVTSLLSKSTVDVVRRFQEALAQHQQGHLLEAKAGYEAILKVSPKHFDAHHLLGVIFFNFQQLEDARRLITQALEIWPDNSDACYNMGLVMDGLGRKHEAIDFYDKAVQANPENFKAYNNKSKSCLDLGLLDEAFSSSDAAVKLKPDYAEAFNNRGTAQLRQEDLGGALGSFDQALRLKPTYADAHISRGHTLRAMKQWDVALASYDQAIQLRPNAAPAYDGRGLVLQSLLLPEAALISFEYAIKLDPHEPSYLQHCADALAGLQRFTQAVAQYDQALKLRPDFPEVMANRGNALLSLKKHEAALDSYRQAIALKPQWAEARNNEGNALLGLGRIEESIESYKTALALKPAFAESHGNLGNALLGLGLYSEAMSQYDEVIRLRPDLAESHWNKSLLYLLQGDFENGWKLYEHRWQSRVQSAQFRNFPQPLWLGEQDIKEKTILLHAEQGLGDTLQFCRYAKNVANLGARVILEVQAPLAPLLRELPEVDVLIEKGEKLPDFDFQVPLLSLPIAFKTQLQTIPSESSYLKTSQEKLLQWGKRIGQKNLPRVGLVWRGNPGHGNDLNRSMPLGLLLPYLPNGIDYFCLQKELRDEDSDELSSDGRIKFFGTELEDFSDTAALCDLMDVVISVDTSVAHLSAGLGRATWILLPNVPDWRWLLERTDSPWYPQAKLYRQDQSRTWDSVLTKVGADLKSRFLL